MNLCIDIGNTRCKFALFEQANQVDFGVVNDFDKSDFDKIRTNFMFNNT